ncbi:antibiotic transport-associated protein [Thermogymnomonas acidicola]|uniref:Antibiotic transport-associated protein n=1 Tax=Thermogymnomonas acidicola TaxID=399579 RepID=A0AA37BS55_9ARCH|nr:antibiotic transport-associated protein [Thermogymnomonas acidicola]
MLAITPAVLDSSHYINYSNQVVVNSKSESAQAQRIISSDVSNNSSLIVVIQESSWSSVWANSTAQRVLQLQSALQASGVPHYSHSTSVYSAYASLIDKYLSGKALSLIKETYGEVQSNSNYLFTFPHTFYTEWSKYGFSNSSISLAAKASGFNGNNSYEAAFLQNLNMTAGMPGQRIEEAVSISLVKNYINDSLVPELTVFNYTSVRALSEVTSGIISEAYGFNLDWQYIESAVSSSDPGYFFVTHFGLSGIPSFLNSTYDASNITLLYVVFSTPSGKDVQGSETASEAAYSKVNAIVRGYFDNAIVTGNGAIAYETNQQTAKSGFIFGLLFIFLAISILFALWSWKSAVLVFIFSGISLLLGMASEFLAGLIFHSVSFIVNYTLEAVLLGISADYLLFILSRFREELRAGRSEQEAIETAAKESGKSILVSGLTVALSLFTFYFIPGFRDWGFVLFVAVLSTVALETLLLPPVASIFGKRLFIQGKLRPASVEDTRKSAFYRISDRSIGKRYAVIAAVMLIGTAGAYGFFHVPTTYNFNTGLPESLPAVRGLNLIQSDFGASQIYPVYVIVNLSSLPDPESALHSYAQMLLSVPGIARGYGPYLNGTEVSSGSNYSQFVIGHRYALYTLYLSSSPYSQSAIDTVKEIRSERSLIVGGLTSSIIDQQAQNSKIYSELEALIVVVIGLVIGLSFRTWKYPLVSLTGVLFSVSWSTLILYAVSRYLLHEALIYLIPVILFLILFSLGSDYTVFIISRINENRRSLGLRESINRGIASSGRTVSTLGIILAVSLGSLSAIPVPFLQQLGISFIISLLLDTFLIRTVYFPAMISALYRRQEN